MKLLKPALKMTGLALLVLIAIMLFRTWRYQSVQISVPPVPVTAVSDVVANHLAEAIRFKTVSYDEPGRIDSTEFYKLLDYLKKTYPLSDSLLHPRRINKLSLLYCWKGTNPALKPALLMGHMDVVPAEDGNKEWTRPPFSGFMDSTFIWGRGTMDDKVNVIAILESVEMLLKEGYQPKRTIYLAFGHDEEIGGANGAEKIAEYLKQENIRTAYVLDEGLVIARGIVPGITKDVALIGIAEKGYASVELSVTLEGGHSSIPAKETPIGVLAAAVSRLEKNQMPSMFCAPVKAFLNAVGPEMPFFQKLVFANQWLLDGVIRKKYETSAAGNASVRTTSAPTVFKAGSKDNVLPGSALAIVNFRILPGQSVADVMAHVHSVVQDPRVTITLKGRTSEPSRVSDPHSADFLCIEKSIRQIFSQALIAPSLVVAATDSKHYAEVSENQYRFLPLIAKSEDLSRIHGLNERISRTNFADCIRFYRQLILNSNL